MKTRFPWDYVVWNFNGNERIKCSWYVEFKIDVPFDKDRRTTIQVSDLNDHAKLESHKFSLHLLEGETKWSNLQITKHIELMVDIEMERIILVIVNMYFVST